MGKILTIIGPTAIGKTGISIELAKQLNAEVIGLDSRQIYYGMEIGTAQPNVTEQARIRHHLIGIRSPDEVITAGEYAKLVDAVIVDIKERNKTPIICGGAGLYHRALREGIFEGSASDSKIRKQLEERYDSDPQLMIEKLNQIDPQYAEIVHINNKKRLVRALEIFELTGKTPSEHFREQSKTHSLKLDLYSVLFFMDKDLLYQRICKRTDHMLADGLIDEVKSLLSNYNPRDIHPLDSIGYKQVIKYINGKISYEEMIEEINIRTRQYAKKQITWFKNEPIDYEVHLSDNNPSEIVEKIILNYNTAT